MSTGIKVNNKISQALDIKIEPFDVNNRYTGPHRHNKYLELVYFSKGSGFHFMDQEKYKITSQSGINKIYSIGIKVQINDNNNFNELLNLTFREKTCDGSL